MVTSVGSQEIPVHDETANTGTNAATIQSTSSSASALRRRAGGGVKSVVSFVYPSFHRVAPKTADLSNKFIIQYNFVFRYWKTSLMNVKKI